jgi:NADH-quinone oxidoreductase subunit E
MLRRLHPDQPDSFAFTPANQAWAEAQITKYPEGRQASAIIPLLWRAQEQEGWLTRPAIEHVCDMLGLAHIRGLEVATFYFMFQLAPVGSVAHIQICGTTSCMICGAEDLVAVCKRQDRREAAPAVGGWQVFVGRGRMPWGLRQRADGADRQGLLRGPDGGEAWRSLSTTLPPGKVPTPGPQNGRYASEPASGLTSLTEHEAGRDASERLGPVGGGYRRHDQADRRDGSAFAGAVGQAVGRGGCGGGASGACTCAEAQGNPCAQGSPCTGGPKRSRKARRSN